MMRGDIAPQDQWPRRAGMQSYLDFEKPVADLEGKIAELKAMAASDQAVSIDDSSLCHARAPVRRSTKW